jgi:hypothetical protein
MRDSKHEGTFKCEPYGYINSDGKCIMCLKDYFPNKQKKDCEERTCLSY